MKYLTILLVIPVVFSQFDENIISDNDIKAMDELLNNLEKSVDQQKGDVIVNYLNKNKVETKTNKVNDVVKSADQSVIVDLDNYRLKSIKESIVDRQTMISEFHKVFADIKLPKNFQKIFESFSEFFQKSLEDMTRGLTSDSDSPFNHKELMKMEEMHNNFNECRKIAEPVMTRLAQLSEKYNTPELKPKVDTSEFCFIAVNFVNKADDLKAYTARKFEL
ncbi:uncharacterized protein LOC128952300 [Oppia nitens]|uniref:uncharacterized protein LOC128952300 n=1 Tax=Oppia nitens TaxID=1686743 RepID=UPI0023DA9835|nr:uncharacterized protein LOC128952300 [Oppia nitens]